MPDQSVSPRTNRLIHENSPYLLQHAHNPVDWHPWGEEAFALAREQDKPVFLSVGYSTCHWCHVMERESFEREDVAALLNEHFIPIKVDREERPDVDAIYMAATQLITGSGGWPNSVWLTPDGRPWYAGTYFPREDRAGHPGFKTLLRRLADMWRHRRADVEAQANELSEAVRRLAAGRSAPGPGELSRELIAPALQELAADFDDRYGGFGGAPKFPPHSSLRLLFHEYRRTGEASLLRQATRTLDAMALGGLHDHLGGGFHRYSTDVRWFLPHFEKMLYDNAQLCRAYVDGYLLTQEEDYRRVAVRLCEWVLHEMTDRRGGFYSALDADSEGQEGKFYVWTPAEIHAVLGPEEGDLFCRVYHIQEGGNFSEEATGESSGSSIPFLHRPLGELAGELGLTEPDLRSRLTAARTRLLEHRAQRVWPHLDDKVLAGWNGLMIAGLAYAGRHLNEPRYTGAAREAARFVLSAMRRDGRLLHSFRDGEAQLKAYLDDYACLAEGLLELYETTGDGRWLAEARSLVETLLAHFLDPTGGFFFAPDDHENLLVRAKDPFDQATPSGNGVAARVLLWLGQLTGEQRYLELAGASLESYVGLMEQVPRGTQSLLLATSQYLDLRESVASETGAELAPGISAAAPDARVRRKPLTVEAFASRLRVVPGESSDVALRLTVDPGWHANSHTPLQDYQPPTLVSAGTDVAYTFGEVAYPEGHEHAFPFSPEPLSVYEGAVWFRVSLNVLPEAPPGPLPAQVELRLQACDDRKCLPPASLALTLPLEVVHGQVQEDLRHADLFHSLGTPEEASDWGSSLPPGTHL